MLQSSLDWSVLVDLADRHRLMLQLHAQVQEAGRTSAPREVMLDLWQFEERNARAARSRAAELWRLLRLFESRGIRSIPYKGPVLAHALYGDVTRRVFGDLDLLVEPRNLRAARTLLEAEGYEVDAILSEATEAALLRGRLHYHRVLINHSTGVMVELHWKTDPDYPVERVEDEAWWSALPAASVDGLTFRRFSDEELLLVLCLHGTRHHGYRLGWLAEVAELIRRQPNLDWAWITSRAAALACSRRLRVALLLAGALLGVAAPAPVLNEAKRDPAARLLVDQIVSRLFRPGLHEPTSTDRLGMSLRFYERRSDRVRHVFDVAFAPSLHEWSRWPLPRGLFVLYLPFRLARLAGKYGAKLARRS